MFCFLLFFRDYHNIVWKEKKSMRFDLIWWLMMMDAMIRWWWLLLFPLWLSLSLLFAEMFFQSSFCLYTYIEKKIHRLRMGKCVSVCYVIYRNYNNGYNKKEMDKIFCLFVLIINTNKKKWRKFQFEMSISLKIYSITIIKITMKEIQSIYLSIMMFYVKKKRYSMFVDKGRNFCCCCCWNSEFMITHTCDGSSGGINVCVKQNKKNGMNFTVKQSLSNQRLNLWIISWLRGMCVYAIFFPSQKNVPFFFKNPNSWIKLW